MKQSCPCGQPFAANFVSPYYGKKYLLRSFFAVMLLMIFVLPVISQPLTGTKTIPGDYATIKTAVIALNTYGVGTGGVTFNVSAGYSETLASDSIYNRVGNRFQPHRLPEIGNRRQSLPDKNRRGH